MFFFKVYICFFFSVTDLCKPGSVIDDEIVPAYVLTHLLASKDADDLVCLLFSLLITLFNTSVEYLNIYFCQNFKGGFGSKLDAEQSLLEMLYRHNHWLNDSQAGRVHSQNDLTTAVVQG